jgi:hypothetical protein
VCKIENRRRRDVGAGSVRRETAQTRHAGDEPHEYCFHNDETPDRERVRVELSKGAILGRASSLDCEIGSTNTLNGRCAQLRNIAALVLSAAFVVPEYDR